MTEKPIDLQPLSLACAQLREAIAVWQDQPDNSILKKHLRAGVIQAFEYTYELSVKMLSHTYSEARAVEVSEQCETFLVDAESLLIALKAQT